MRNDLLELVCKPNLSADEIGRAIDIINRLANNGSFDVIDEYYKQALEANQKLSQTGIVLLIRTAFSFKDNLSYWYQLNEVAKRRGCGVK